MYSGLISRKVNCVYHSVNMNMVCKGSTVCVCVMLDSQNVILPVSALREQALAYYLHLLSSSN